MFEPPLSGEARRMRASSTASAASAETSGSAQAHGRTGLSPSPTAPAAEPTASERVPGKQRDPFFDNAKYLAIVLVAIGHSWEPLRSSSRSVTALYTLVYAVHMPAFIVISGYFSRSFRATPPQIRRLLGELWCRTSCSRRRTRCTRAGRTTNPTAPSACWTRCT